MAVRPLSSPVFALAAMPFRSCLSGPPSFPSFSLQSCTHCSCRQRRTPCNAPSKLLLKSHRQYVAFPSCHSNVFSTTPCPFPLEVVTVPGRSLYLGDSNTFGDFRTSYSLSGNDATFTLTLVIASTLQCATLSFLSSSPSP